MTMKMMSDFVIEPCVLVRDRITLDRGVSYYRRDVQVVGNEDGSEDATWHTERHYKDRTESKDAERIYAKVRQNIRQVCLSTDIGFICPIAKKDDLEKVIQSSRELVDEFNLNAKYCKVNFLVVCTNIDPNNQDGVTLLRNTLEKSVDTIRTSLANFDVTAARSAVNATKKMIDVMADPGAKDVLAHTRDEVSTLCKEVAKLVKQFDGNIQNAIVSTNGQELLKRANAIWNF